MLPITQKWIFRSDLQNNPGVFYLFGDNCERVGMGGQAKEMRHEPNAIGVATKLTPTSGSNAFFSDDTFTEHALTINSDLKRAFIVRDAGHLIIIPEDGLGTGLSELPTRAPHTNRFLERMLERLRTGGAQ